MPFGSIFSAAVKAVPWALGGFKKADAPLDDLAGAGGAIGHKVFGIPPPVTGAQLGEQQRAYMDQAFPGTNPWERLGQSSALSPVEVAQEQRKTQSKQLQVQERIANKQMATQERVAQIGAGATKFATAFRHGPEGLRAMEQADEGRPIGAYDTEVSIKARKVSSEIKKLDAESRLALERALLAVVQAQRTESEAKIKAAEALFRRSLARLKVGKDFQSAVGSLGRRFPIGLLLAVSANSDEDVDRAIERMHSEFRNTGRKLRGSIGPSLKWLRRATDRVPSGPLGKDLERALGGGDSAQ